MEVSADHSTCKPMDRNNSQMSRCCPAGESQRPSEEIQLLGWPSMVPVPIKSISRTPTPPPNDDGQGPYFRGKFAPRTLRQGEKDTHRVTPASPPADDDGQGPYFRGKFAPRTLRQDEQDTHRVTPASPPTNDDGQGPYFRGKFAPRTLRQDEEDTHRVNPAELIALKQAAHALAHPIVRFQDVPLIREVPANVPPLSAPQPCDRRISRTRRVKSKRRRDSQGDAFEDPITIDVSPRGPSTSRPIDDPSSQQVPRGTRTSGHDHIKKVNPTVKFPNLDFIDRPGLMAAQRPPYPGDPAGAPWPNSIVSFIFIQSITSPVLNTPARNLTHLPPQVPSTCGPRRTRYVSSGCLTNHFSLSIQALSYTELLHAHKTIEAFSPELDYERAAAYMYFARISQLRSEQAALQSFNATRDRLLTFANTLEEDLANLDLEEDTQ
jgi:hypothetical protein